MFFNKKVYCFLQICLFSLGFHSLLAQDQRIADSLKIIYDQNILKDTAKLELLRQLSFNELNNLDLAISYSDELISLSELANNNNYLFHGYYASGNKYRTKGELDVALSKFLKSTEIAINKNNITQLGTAYLGIADVYAVMGDFQRL